MIKNEFIEYKPELGANSREIMFGKVLNRPGKISNTIYNISENEDDYDSTVVISKTQAKQILCVHVNKKGESRLYRKNNKIFCTICGKIEDNLTAISLLTKHRLLYIPRSKHMTKSQQRRLRKFVGKDFGTDTIPRIKYGTPIIIHDEDYIQPHHF